MEALNPLRTVVETAFRCVARWRRGRAVHTRGVELDAELTLDPDSVLGRALDVSGSCPALVRVSRSWGCRVGGRTCSALPWRVSSGRGDEVLDVLFAAVASRGWAYPLLIPARSWSGRPWSTVLTYTRDGHLVWLGLKTPAGPAGGGADVAVVAAAVGHGAVSLAVTEMVAGAARRPVGTLRWDAVRQRGTSVSIDPVLNSVVGLRSVRLLSGLREWAYTGSRQGAVPPGAGLAIDPRAAGTSR
jgi:hypothetical protein